MQEFNPNRLTFDEGIDRIKRALESAGTQFKGGIVTSQDDDVKKVSKLLEVDNVPAGFKKYQLPVYLDCSSQLFVTVAEAGAKAAPHSHDVGDGIRFIASGSITYKGKRLKAGDWMFIPAGQSYSFEVGPEGAVMCYCYCCCCA